MTKPTLKLFYKENKAKSPLIIFIHGAACDHTIWCFQNRYFFNRGYSILTLDLPGHGENISKPCNSIKEMRDLIKLLLDKFPQKEIILVGHSMGSLICLDILDKKTTKVKKVFLIGVSVPMHVSETLIEKSKNNQEQAIGDMINWSLTNKVKLKGAKLIGTNLPNLVNVVMSNSKKGILHKDLLSCNNYSINNNLKDFKGQVNIILGEKDIMTPVRGVNSLKNIIPNLNISLLKEVGHFHMLEDPIGVNKIIETNLQKK